MRRSLRPFTLGLLCAALLGTACTNEDPEDLGDELGSESGDTGAEPAEEPATETGEDEPEASTGAVDDPFIPGLECDDELGITWESFGQGFILSQCAGCHSSYIPEDMRAGAPVGIDFETHELTQQWLLRIYARAADEDTMPPIDGVPSDERVMLAEWLACGAP
ncbi:MAG: hypothetical protein AAF799_32980 [Myxococcota bacterium]